MSLLKGENMKEETANELVKNISEIIDSLKTIQTKTKADEQIIQINLNKLKIFGGLIYAAGHKKEENKNVINNKDN